MSGAAAGQRIRYVVAPPATGGAAVPEPGSTAAVYAGPLTISASSLVRAMVYAADNVATGDPTTAHYVRLATTGAARLDPFSSQLPLLVIDTHGSGPLVKADGVRPGWIYTWPRPATGGTTLTAAPAAVSSVGANVRGASSAEFPKKSYTVRLDDTLGRDHPLPLYGLPAFENWTLIGPWNYDRTFLNNAFIYALSNRLGRWAARTQFVEVFFNANGGNLDAGDYVGIYVLIDSLRLEPKRVDLAKLEPTDVESKKITGGYLLKIDLPDPNEFNFQLRRSFPGLPFALAVSQPKLAELASAQRACVKNFVQGFDDALTANVAAGWRNRTHPDSIDRASRVDRHILNVLAMNVDGLARSTYLTKDGEGRLNAGPVWDFDRALGGGDPRSQNYEVWMGDNGATDYWTYGWWGLLAQDPEFLQAWVDRWQLLRRTELSAPSLGALVDTLAGQIGPAAAARDAARWPDNAPRFASGWQGEVDALKAWLARRATWIDTHFAAAPAVVAGAGTLTVTPAPGTQLAYTNDGTDPRAPGRRPGARRARRRRVGHGPGHGRSPGAQLPAEFRLVRRPHDPVEFGRRRRAVLAPDAASAPREPLQPRFHRHRREYSDRGHRRERHRRQTLPGARRRARTHGVWRRRRAGAAGPPHFRRQRARARPQQRLGVRTRRRGPGRTDEGGGGVSVCERQQGRRVARPPARRTVYVADFQCEHGHGCRPRRALRNRPRDRPHPQPLHPRPRARGRRTHDRRCRGARPRPEAPA